MGARESRIRSLVGVLLCLAALLALATTAGCSGDSGGGDATSTGSNEVAATQAVADTEHAIETSVVAADGGVVGTATHSGALVRVTFPSGTLAADTSIVITPLATAPMEDETVIDKGFLLEEAGTGAGPALSTPVWVEWVLPTEVGDDVAMVTYNDDGTYEVLPTKIVSGNGRTAALALVTHFSPSGMRNVGKDKAGKARDKFSTFNWIVFIKNTQEAQYGPIRQSIALDLEAANTGGDIAGDYTGTAGIASTNDAEIMGGTMTSPQSGTAGSVNITLKSLDPLASLSEEDPLASLVDPNDPLAPLVPDEPTTKKALDKMPQWWGTGSITMSSMSVKGSATGTIGGYSGTGGTKDTSTLPVTMEVYGTQVSLTVTGLAPGSMTFKGYVIGQGK